MFRPTYRWIAALTLSAAMALTVATSENSHDPAPVADGHWCC